VTEFLERLPDPTELSAGPNAASGNSAMVFRGFAVVRAGFVAVRATLFALRAGLRAGALFLVAVPAIPTPDRSVCE
jgi:hypothetical protein